MPVSSIAVIISSIILSIPGDLHAFCLLRSASTSAVKIWGSGSQTFALSSASFPVAPGCVSIIVSFDAGSIISTVRIFDFFYS